MEVKTYSSLPQEAKNIRTAVFIEEQKFKAEFDGIDSLSRHLVVFDGNTPVATCRIYTQVKEGRTVHIIGRIAVIRQYRGKGVGSFVLKNAEREIIENGGSEVFLHSQCTAKNFYLKNGYTEFGATDFDEDCPHIWMYKQLNA